jgi:hypothetical protein
MARGQHGGRTFWAAPHPVLPIPETITASPVLVIATETQSTPYCGGVAIARARGPSANLPTVYLVEVRVPGGHAC